MPSEDKKNYILIAVFSIFINMLLIHLDKEKKKNLQVLQRETTEKRVYRKVSTLLGLDSGLSIAQVAVTLGVDQTTVKRYKKTYIKYGLEKYLSDNYQAYWGKLTSHQIVQLIKELKTTIQIKRRLFFVG